MMAYDNVLIVDDDPAIRKILKKVLTSNQINCSEASTGEIALNLIQAHSYDLILLDIMLEGIDGFDVIQRIRNLGIDIPIMILSGRTEDYDTLFGLGLGADDYITKPFNPIIVGAKIKALIRRNKKALANKNDAIVIGPFKYDLTSLRFFKDNEEIFLSSKENLLIKFFLENVNRTFTKSQIYENVWGDSIIDENSVAVYISYLRHKIEKDPKNPDYLKTVWGLGYKFLVYPCKKA